MPPIKRKRGLSAYVFISVLMINFLNMVYGRLYCSRDDDCPYSYDSQWVCCKRKYYEAICRRNGCVGESCSRNSDCAPGEYCCWDDVCRASSSSCTHHETGLAGWLVAMIVVCISIFTGIAIGLFCCYCAKSAARNRGRAGLVVAYRNRPGGTASIYPAGTHIVQTHQSAAVTSVAAPATKTYKQNVPNQAGPLPYGPPPPYSSLQPTN